ncbi:MAG: hypothetical protein GQ522_05720 [Deltaproteobacteria bacterium]|nr:hypothetical protein [Deltaproteobacteria bacterium]
MPNKLDIAVIWHMHQPYYKDLASGEYLLPWVRLHAIKDYYDMPLLLDNFSGIRQTFNLVPSLLIQLEDYAKGAGRDLFLEVSRKPASDLTEAERGFILSNFFHANRENMIKPLPRYWKLLHKRGFNFNNGSTIDAIRFFSESDFRDLQFLFNLCWFDPSIQQTDPFLASMVKKGSMFDESEKEILFETQREIISRVIPNYRRLMEEGKAELTTTPFYHPILPLLCNTDIASQALPHATLPAPPFVHPEDGELQVERAVNFHKELFGSAPKGMWPSEGSVSEEALSIIASNGIEWVATDEEILEATTGKRVNRGGDGHLRNPEFLYRPYRCDAGVSDLALLFRDHHLSDRIGFVYQHWDAATAARDFVDRLHHIRTSLGAKNKRGEYLVPVILDGENCWEHYKNDGRDFLMALYEMIEEDPLLDMVTVSDHLKAHPPTPKLDTIFPGSWINHNFKIWIGHEEDNRAWEYLKAARDALVAAKERGGVAEKSLERAWEHIYIAEGSDWCWWYGDENSTENDADFDLLFRKNLINVYTEIGVDPPSRLFTPIVQEEEVIVAPSDLPLSLIHPTIDGEVTNYFEWLGAPLLKPGSRGGAMQMGGGAGEGVIKDVYYGFNTTTLFFRFDYFSPDQTTGCWSFTIHFLAPTSMEVNGLISDRVVDASISSEGDASESKGCKERLESICAGDIVELGVDFEKIRAAQGEEIRFFIDIKTDKGEESRCPTRGHCLITVPTEDYERYNWYV